MGGMIISLDTETTGVDIAHGAMPFLVTTCDGDGVIRFWEWDVDPLTRRPEVPSEDVVEIAELIDAADLIYLHNSKFDVRALATIGVALPWSKVRDSLVGSHLLGSNHSHKLKDEEGFDLCQRYLGVDISKYENHTKVAVQECRAIAKREFPDWRIAREDLPDMPSVTSSSKRDEDKPWKNDMWLPRALAYQLNADRDAFVDEDWLIVCSQYANTDSEHTLYLGLEIERIIRERGLWKIYEHSLQVMRVYCEMESFGVTARGDYTENTIREFEEHVAESEAAMVAIAADYGHDLELAKGASINDNMRDFFYGAVHQSCPRCSYTKRVKHWSGEDANGAVCPKCLKGTKHRAGVSHSLVTTERANLALPVIASKKTSSASLDADAMKEYLATTEGAVYDFLALLTDKRAYDTALSYMEAYRRYWLPIPGAPGYYRIHSSLNPCATDHLRAASNSPNLQNVSGESKVISNKGCFGPLPGREWWNMDFRQIEARIPAYESGEPKLIELFDRPDEPPYWGSTYNLVASIFYPDKYRPHAEKYEGFKKGEPALYKRAKFHWLARQYGAGKAKGDRLAGFDGACDMLTEGLPLLAELQAKYMANAVRLGYVETLPDRTVDPERGYPILASRTDDGKVLSTTPFNYHVSGSACWAKRTALVRCAGQCAMWREEGFDAHVALEVHDSLLFDFPGGKGPEENYDRAMVLKGLMEQSGEDLIPRVPTPVSVEYHSRSWAEGIAV